jgi:protein SCO1
MRWERRGAHTPQMFTRHMIWVRRRRPEMIESFLRSHPEEHRQRVRPLAGPMTGSAMRLEGWHRVSTLHPSFETRACGALLRMRPRDEAFISWRRLRSIAALNISLALCWPGATLAQDHHQHHDNVITEAIKAEPVEARRIPDIQLTDQRGHQARFLSDVLRQRVAIVSFIYTSCETTCPLVGATVAAIADDFQREGANLAIVSISVDPDFDTPARLLAWRERFGDLPQWTLLTGPRREVEQLLRAFGTYSANIDDHSDILLIGPDAAGRWTRLSAFAETDLIAAAIRSAVSSTGK